MKILGIDTSASTGSLALAEYSDQSDLKLIDTRQWSGPSSHTNSLGPQLSEMLSAHSLSLNELNLLVVLNGPGSFTGLRIGVAFTKALAFAAHIPAVSLDMFSVLATMLTSEQAQDALMIEYAFRDLYYVAPWPYDADKVTTLTEVQVLAHWQQGTSLIGPGVAKLQPPSVRENTRLFFRPRPLALDLLKAWSLLKPKPVSAFDLNPVYFRASEAEIKLRGS